jgi:hypothetical protein
MPVNTPERAGPKAAPGGTSLLDLLDLRVAALHGILVLLRISFPNTRSGVALRAL